MPLLPPPQDTPRGGSAPPEPLLLNGACSAVADCFVFFRQRFFHVLLRVRDGDFLVLPGCVLPPLTSYCLHNILLPTHSYGSPLPPSHSGAESGAKSGAESSDGVAAHVLQEALEHAARLLGRGRGQQGGRRVNRGLRSPSWGPNPTRPGPNLTQPGTTLR